MATARKIVPGVHVSANESKTPPAAGPANPTLQESVFAHLLKIESDARRATSIRELDSLFSMESRKLLRARQVFVVQYDSDHSEVLAMTGVAIVDRSTPIVTGVEAIIRRMVKEVGLSKAVGSELPGFADPGNALTQEYPFRFVYWQPMWSPVPAVKVGALYFREKAWFEADTKIAARLGETFGHARALLGATQPILGRFRINWKYALAGCLAAALISLLPVPISVLAPVEVVPRDADVVAMPADGIVHKVLVQPNARVEKGTPLVKLLETVDRNRAEIAAREVAVAKARLEQATILAFSDPKGRQDFGIANAELALKMAEEQYAKDLLERTAIKAERSGIAVLSDARDLEGKPFSAGQRLMLIARDGDSELKVSLPVADSIVLRPGLKVRAFLDSAPLDPVDAEISHVDSQVRVDESQTASYRVTAQIAGPTTGLTLGARGTAQIQGERAPLFVYLFRRPLTFLRQRIGR
jgi:hypothetical protein